MALWAFAGSAAAQKPLYYQDPDGKPLYAPGPKQTADGRDYRPVFQAAAPKPPPNAPHRILYYRNPMGLADTSPVPRKDAMGMDYVPVYADDSAQGDAPGTVRISAGRMQTLGVRTEPAEIGAATPRTIRATGILQYDERRLATITTKVPGWIEHLAVAATGDPVRRGQTLAEIYSPDLVASENEYLVAAEIGGALASASAERLRALDIPQAEINRLRRTGRAAHRIAIVAAENGVVIDKPAQEGMRVDAGEALYRTAYLGNMWLIAQVPEQDIGAIEPGQIARANFVAFPGRVFQGNVEFIYPSLSAETRTAQVRIVLANPDGALRAAMFANVEVAASPANAPVVTVPNSAVLDSGTRQVVLIDRGEGRFEPLVVHTGIRGDERVQVLDGIKAGDRVVVGANFLIDAESNLRAALQGFADNTSKAAAPTGPKP